MLTTQDIIDFYQLILDGAKLKPADALVNHTKLAKDLFDLFRAATQANAKVNTAVILSQIKKLLSGGYFEGTMDSSRVESICKLITSSSDIKDMLDGELDIDILTKFSEMKLNVNTTQLSPTPLQTLNLYSNNRPKLDNVKSESDRMERMHRHSAQTYYENAEKEFKARNYFLALQAYKLCKKEFFKIDAKRLIPEDIQITKQAHQGIIASTYMTSLFLPPSISESSIFNEYDLLFSAIDQFNSYMSEQEISDKDRAYLAGLYFRIALLHEHDNAPDGIKSLSAALTNHLTAYKFISGVDKVLTSAVLPSSTHDAIIFHSLNAMLLSSYQMQSFSNDRYLELQKIINWIAKNKIYLSTDAAIKSKLFEIYQDFEAITLYLVKTFNQPSLYMNFALFKGLNYLLSIYIPNNIIANILVAIEHNPSLKAAIVEYDQMRQDFNSFIENFKAYESLNTSQVADIFNLKGYLAYSYFNQMTQIEVSESVKSYNNTNLAKIDDPRSGSDSETDSSSQSSYDSTSSSGSESSSSDTDSESSQETQPKITNYYGKANTQFGNKSDRLSDDDEAPVNGEKDDKSPSKSL